jgi:predicted GNAT family acetyltransferase
VWVWAERGRLVFKADVMSETPEAAYLEGVYVRPEERGKGYGRRCLSQLSRALLARSESVCLVVNEQNKDAQEFFFKSGFKLRGLYDSIFLEPKAGGRA